MSSVSISIRHAMPRSSASTKRPPFRPSTFETACCRSRPAAPNSHGFEYKRNGTLSLYAALNTKTGEVQGKTAARHTSTADLARKLRRYINAYSKNAQPIRWKYSNPSRRIRHANTSSATVH